MMAEDGKVYERAAIEQWLNTHATSPLTSVQMGKKLLLALQVKNMVKGGAVVGDKADAWHKRLEEAKEVEECERKAVAGDGNAANTLAIWYLRGG